MTLLSGGLGRIYRSVSVLGRCSSAKGVYPSRMNTVNSKQLHFSLCQHPSRYTVKKTMQVHSSLCRCLCEGRSPEAPERMNIQDQDESCQSKKEDVEDSEKLPRPLPLPSQEFLDLLNDRQLDHYKSILYKYENSWSKLFGGNMKVPTVLTDSNWRYILGFGTTRTADILRKFYYKELKKKLKKETKLLEGNKENWTEHKHSTPGKASIKAYNIIKTFQAMEHGQELVFDLGFKSDDQVGHIFREEARIRKQLQETIHDNAKQRFPFHLVFCNVNEWSHSMLEEVAADIPITITDQCYLSMFVKQDLVYLSPDAVTELKTFNHKHIYIVGCITDLVTKPFTRTKAYKQRIKCRSFPIKKYLGNITSELLTLNNVANILHDMKDTGDWTKALKHVPQRFQKSQDHDHEMKQKQKFRRRK